MINKEILEIIPRLLDEAGITELNVKEARDPVLFKYGDDDPVLFEYGDDLELIDKDYPMEYDLLIPQPLRHRQLQQIDTILKKFRDVEMETTDDGLCIRSIL